MVPVKFDGMNKTLTAPVNWDELTNGKCSPLHIQASDGQCMSCWRLSIMESIRLLLRRKIYLTVVSGHTQPPVKLSVEK